MTDIKERALIKANVRYGEVSSFTKNGFYNGYVDGATDQDTISRADERKKVLNEVYEWLANYEPLLQSNCIASDLINRLRMNIEK